MKLNHKIVKPKGMIRIGILFAYLLCLGCGVRGDPLPPETPTELGRGRPNYKRATEEIQLKDPQNLELEEPEEEEEEEEVF